MPRCASGHVLTLTPALRAAWRSCRQAKTRPALMRRAGVWLDALTAETQRREGEAKQILHSGNICGGRTRLQTPELLTKTEPHAFTLGTYHHSLMQGIHSITVVIDRPLDDVRETLIHEALHYLDCVANIDDHGHDRYWLRRLGRMRELFPVIAWGHGALAVP